MLGFRVYGFGFLHRRLGCWDCGLGSVLCLRCWGFGMNTGGLLQNRHCNSAESPDALSAIQDWLGIG